jgi:H+-transporting ATPase
MAPLGWKWAGLVWAYAIVWALINDRIKLLAYRIFDPIQKPSVQQQASAPVDDTQAISARAYESYQQRVHGESQQDQDWLAAEQETHRDEQEHKKIA